MKTLLPVLLAVAVSTMTLFAQESTKGAFGEKEYDAFHKILRPLQHKALPAKDFSTIRTQAPSLIEKGNMIVALKIPDTMPKKAEYEKTIKVFAAALQKLGADAAKGKDDQLRKSYLAVHDTYEKLVGMLP